MAAPTIAVNAGFASGLGNSYGFYDGVTDYGGTFLYAPDFIPHDITTYCRTAGFTTTRGAQSLVTSGFVANAGVLTGTLDNTTRQFDPNYTSNVYRQATVNKVVPGVPIVVTTSYNAVNYTLYTGSVDEWPQKYPALGRDQTVDLRATDNTATIANSNLSIIRPAELTGSRISAVLGAIGYFGPTSIAAGSVLVEALTSTTGTSISAWNHMSECVLAESGDLYFSADGTLTFRGNTEITTDTRSTVSQATFGESELRYADLTMGSPPIVNRCIITNGAGVQTQADDFLSQGQPWGLRTLTLSLPFVDIDGQGQDYCDFVVQRFAWPVTTIASMTLIPERGSGVTSGVSNLLPQAFGRELGDRITVIRRVTLDGAASTSVTADCFIRGISHSYQDQKWIQTVFSLQDASWT